MKTRLKYYTKDTVEYTDWFTVGPNFIIRGTITSSNYVEIRELNTSILYEFQASSNRYAKAKLKKQLSSIGVKFSDEIRNRFTP